MADRWEWRRNFLWRQGGDFVLYYTVNDDGLHGTDADKRLAAAAPDLLEALQEAEVLYQVGLLNAADGQATRVHHLRQAAIAKALGQ